MAVAYNFNFFLNSISEKIADKFSADIACLAMCDKFFVMELANDYDIGRTADEALSMHIAEIAVTYA